MKRTNREATTSVVGRALCVAAVAIATMGGWACSSDSTPAAETCPSNNPECKLLATKEDGAKAISKRECTKCHGDDMSGSATALPNIPDTPLGDKVELFPPNLTSDVTGVAPPEKGGKWTDDALALAIRTGIDDESQALCPQMKHFSDMSDFEVYSIVAYLRSIPPVSKKVPRSVCPPTKTKEQQNL